MTSSAYDRMQAEGELARVQAGEYDWGAAEESRKRATEWALVSIAESLAVLAAPVSSKAQRDARILRESSGHDGSLTPARRKRDA